MTKSLGYLGGGFNPAEKYVRQIALFPHVRVNQKKSKPPARYEIFRKPIFFCQDNSKTHFMTLNCRHAYFQYSGSSEKCRMCI